MRLLTVTNTSSDLPGAKEGQPGGAGAQRVFPVYPGKTALLHTAGLITKLIIMAIMIGFHHCEAAIVSFVSEVFCGLQRAYRSTAVLCGWRKDE